jgi:hypothetical protein
MYASAFWFSIILGTPAFHSPSARGYLLIQYQRRELLPPAARRILLRLIQDCADLARPRCVRLWQLADIPRARVYVRFDPKETFAVVSDSSHRRSGSSRRRSPRGKFREPAGTWASGSSWSSSQGEGTGQADPLRHPIGLAVELSSDLPRHRFCRVARGRKRGLLR